MLSPAGVESGPVVAEKEAAAAVTAAQEAARRQQEQALQHCDADWAVRLGKQIPSSLFGIISIVLHCF